jgi:GntR family transcriptional regulator
VQLQNTRGVPLYVQLRELIREAIRQGRWGPEEALPTEAELQQQYSLSRSTVRQALTELVHEGLLVRHPGRGTFASQPSMVLGMRGLLSFRADLIDRGIRPKREVLTVERSTLPAEGLHFVPELDDLDVVHIFEVRFGDERPLVVFNHYFPYERFAFLLRESDSVKDPDGSLRDLLTAHGITYARALGEVNAVMATKREAKLLELPDRTPVVEIATKTYDVSGRAVEYSRGIFRTDRYAVTLESDWTSKPSMR